MKKDIIKQYNEYEKSHPEQLDLFSFSNVFVDKRDKYSGTVELYDIVPKYCLDDVEKLRKNGKYLDILSKDFVYRKQNMKLNITPARLLQKDGSSKDFFPSQREEIIEDVLRKFATDSNRNEFLDDRLSVKFTLYELQKELKKIKHTYDYNQIRESLEILSKTNIEIKSNNNKVTFSSNMFETFGVVDGNEGVNSNSFEETEERSKKIIYFVRFNSLVSESIKNKSWRIINYEQCMAYRKAISRWLHKRISHMFRTGNIQAPYNIMLSTIIRDSGMAEYDKISNNIRQIEECLKEMINIGSIDRYEMEKAYSEERKNKIEDVKFLLWVSKTFFEDMQLGFLAVRDNKEIKEIQNNLPNNNKNIDSLQAQDNRPRNEIVQKIISLMESEQLSLKSVDVEKLLACVVFDESTKENIIINAKACIEYIKNQEKDGKKCKAIAILTKAIKDNWQPNRKEEDLLSISTEEQAKITSEKINKFISEQPNENIKLMFEKMLKIFDTGTFFCWLMNMKYVSMENSVLTFSVETEFIQDWITKNFLNGIKRKKDGETVWITKGVEQLCQDVCSDIKKVQIIVVKNK